MQRKTDKEGREYIELTPEEAEEADRAGKRLFVGDTCKMLAPEDCKHAFKVSWGFPSNIKYCTKCIYWEFTPEEPTREE